MFIAQGKQVEIQVSGHLLHSSYSFPAICYNFSVFELLTFGKITIGFGISQRKGAEGDRYDGKILEQMVTWHWSIPAVRPLDQQAMKKWWEQQFL